MIRVCSTEDIPKGSVISADVGGTQIAIVHAEDSNFYAVYDECSHEQIALSEGEIDGCTLECWLHGSRFDLRTGEPTGLPATEPVPVYHVEVHDGAVYVNLEANPRVDEASRVNVANRVNEASRANEVNDGARQ